MHTATVHAGVHRAGNAIVTITVHQAGPANIQDFVTELAQRAGVAGRLAAQHRITAFGAIAIIAPVHQDDIQPLQGQVSEGADPIDSRANDQNTYLWIFSELF